MSGARAFARAEDGTETDITEGVQALHGPDQRARRRDVRVIVVVGGQCEEHDGSPCVIAVLEGPAGREQEIARKVREQGYVPHWTAVRDADEWLGAC